jgi:hypothetical protein
MRLTAMLVVFLAFTMGARAAQPQQSQSQPPASSSTPPQTESIETVSPSAVIPRPATPDTSSVDPAQVKALLHQLWLAEFRINDLLTEVHPERWKLSEEARSSFGQTLATLREQLTALEGWRSQLDNRPDSIYLGFMTYSAINATLPRLDAVTRSITQRENASLGAQFSQAGNQLFDTQQSLQPYLAALLQNQDEILVANRNNLAACQSQLSFAMRGRVAPAAPMKNVLPEFKGSRVRRNKAAAGPAASPRQSQPTSAPPPKKP